MANAKQNKFYRTFVKGLLTEASPLTYPEDSSFDELNTVPSRKGNRTRRFGMNYSAENVNERDYDSRRAKNEFMWRAVGNVPALTFLVVQNGNTITFYDRSQPVFADSLKPFSVDINLYTRPGVSDAGIDACKFAAGKGYLFVVNKDIEPLVVTYNKTDDTITVTKISILARDFEGLRDGLQNDQEPENLSKEHHYNLQNQGWVAPRQSSLTGETL